MDVLTILGQRPRVAQAALGSWCWSEELRDLVCCLSCTPLNASHAACRILSHHDDDCDHYAGYDRDRHRRRLARAWSLVLKGNLSAISPRLACGRSTPASSLQENMTDHGTGCALFAATTKIFPSLRRYQDRSFRLTSSSLHQTSELDKLPMWAPWRSRCVRDQCVPLPTEPGVECALAGQVFAMLSDYGRVSSLYRRLPPQSAISSAPCNQQP